MSPRKCVYGVSALRIIEKTGDSSTSLRMTCFAITIVEVYPSFVGPYCHPEEAVRLTKDLLRHRMRPERLAFARPARRHVGHCAPPRIGEGPGEGSRS